MPNMQQKAIAKAQELGVTLTYEPEDDQIEVWSHDAPLTEDPIGQSHTYFVHRESSLGKNLTDAGMWREALRYMEEDLVACKDDCACRADSAQAEPEPTGEPTPEPEPESGDEQDEVAVSERFGVVWPKSVARLFWRALAKDGADILATAHGLSRESNQTKGELYIVGDHDAALRLALDLPELFHAANESLKQWRRTNDNYRKFLPLTKETSGPAFAAEQDYLRDFCRAVAGTSTQDMLAHDGIQAGLAFVNQDAEDVQ